MMPLLILINTHVSYTMEEDIDLVHQLERMSIEPRKPTRDEEMDEKLPTDYGHGLIETDPFLRAIAHGNIIQTQHMLDKGANPNYSTHNQTHSPLHVAVFFGHADIAQLLIQHGARIDSPDYLGYKPLHWAALSNNPTCVTLLTKEGAPIDDPRLWRGETALSRSLIENKTEQRFTIIETLLHAGANPEKIFRCAEHAWLEHIRLRDFFARQSIEERLYCVLR